MEKVLRDYGDALLHGAIFYDADASQPEILWLLKTGIEDGRGRVVGQRLFAVHRTSGGFSRIMPYAMLDLKSPDSPPGLAADLQQHAQEEDAAIDWALDEIVSHYFTEVSDRRNRELAIREEYVRKSLQYLIFDALVPAGRRVLSQGPSRAPTVLHVRAGRCPDQGRRWRGSFCI